MKTFRYFILYKPYGVLSQFSDPVGGKRTLGDLYNFPKDVYPVGRLDENSEGLLFLTNDPKANQVLLGTGTEKVYLAQVEGDPSKEALEQLRQGVDIKVKKKVYRTRGAQVELLYAQPDLPDRDPPIRYRKAIPTSWLSIVLKEGKNRQVRKMTAKVGYPTLRLVRSRFDNWELKGMKIGEVRELFDLKFESR